MDEVVQELDEIEAAAQAIVEQAQNQKSEIEEQIQKEQADFDAKMENDVDEEIARIRKEANDQMSQTLDQKVQENDARLSQLRSDFEKNHTKYAQEIFERIIAM